MYRSGSFLAPVTEPQIEPIRVWHLLTHTSGLTYGFHNTHVTDAIYRKGGFEWGNPPGADLAECCRLWARAAARLPARQRVELRRVDRRARPAGRGRVRAAARRVLPRADLRTARHDRHRLLRPRRGRCERFAALYVPNPATGEAVPAPQALGRVAERAADDARRRRRARRDGTRLPPLHPHAARAAASSTASACSASRTVDYMTRNHLPGNADLEPFGRPLFAETTLRRRRLRPRLLGRARPGGEQGAAIGGRVLVGRRGEHDLLGRPARGDRRCCSSPSCCRRAPTRSARSSSSSSTRPSSTELHQGSDP